LCKEHRKSNQVSMLIKSVKLYFSSDESLGILL
jgi:hypothetical protein